MALKLIKDKIILVTGGAGFIGSHVCEKLIHHGAKVICLDNYDDYYDPAIKKHNIAVLRKNKNFRFINGDICNSRTVDSVFRANKKIGMVIHLAAKAGVRASIADPVSYMKVNLVGTTLLLEACRRNQVTNFIFASSSSVYGNAKTKLFRESNPADLPLSPYGMTKRAGEMLCYTYHHLYGLKIICLRFFTVIGPRQRPDLAIHKFVNAIDNGRAITMYGQGSTSRDYTYVDDIVAGIIKAAENLQGRNNGMYEIINLGRGLPVRLKELIKMIQNKMHKQAKIIQMKTQPGDVDRTFADISKAKRLLHYWPRTDISKGIQSFIDWYLKEN